VNGEEVVLRQLPAAAGHPGAMLLLSAGCAVSEDILIGELDRCSVPFDRVVVDPRAVLVTAADIEAEQELAESIGSTASGTGAALVRRMLRGPNVHLAKHSHKLRSRVRIELVAPMLHEHLDDGGDVIVEGTQGFGLSLLHGLHYPHVTARDTTASGFTMEVGLSPRQVDEIIMVIRTFPIRVGGDSGPLEKEIGWEDIQGISGAPDVVPELTSVTRRKRRVARFDIEAVRQACNYNRPTALAVMGLDRLDHATYGARAVGQLTPTATSFIEFVTSETRVRVCFAGTGFGTFDAVFLPCNEHWVSPCP
jgi:adenylosuccinate synthase